MSTAISQTERAIRNVFAVIQTKDLDGLLACFHEGALLVDPHFPEPRMAGKQVIAKAMAGAFAGMESFGYTVERYCEAREGSCAIVETATHHVLRGNWKLDFPQVFVFDIDGGLLTRMQAYEPYGPHGLVGFFLALSRAGRQFMQWLQPGKPSLDEERGKKP